MLALRMGRTVDELMQSMSSAEFSMWVELYEQDQWGDAKGDFHAALICSTIGNFAGKILPDRAKPLTPSDFMPSLAAKPAPVEEVDPVMFFKAVAASKKFDK